MIAKIFKKKEIMPLQPSFDLLQELSKSMQEGGSCLPKEPFMKLQAGVAPELNYKMEQKSGFKAFGHFVPKFDPTYFQDWTKEKDTKGFYAKVKGMTRIELESLLREELLGKKMNTKLIPPMYAHVAKNNIKTVEGKKMQAGDDAIQKSMNTGTTGPQRNEDPIVCDIPFSNIVNNAAEGKIPVPRLGMMGVTGIDFVPEPPTPKPTLFVIEEYTIASYLGNYGAGKVLKTMSLLPGEKTTITVRTYRESVTTQSRAENVLESFTEDSVSEIQSELENESSQTSSSETGTSHEANVQADAKGSIGVVSGGISAGYTYSQNNSGNRASNINAIARALDKHVQNSNNHREVTVNTTTQSTVTEGEEQTIVREIENPNISRVLNIVFRQLLQEYVTLTYLSNIRIGFTNGDPQKVRIVDVEELDTLLEQVVKEEHIATVRTKLLKHYCKVKSAASGDFEDFIEKKTVNYGQCFETEDGTEEFWSKKAGILDNYSDTGLSIGVKGIILNIQSHSLRTDSFVADALLGQGDALDCFGMRLQDAEAMKAHLLNAQLLQKMTIVDNIEMPENQATNYKKVFSDCCDTTTSTGTETGGGAVTAPGPL
jgi:hypothetical protein